MQAWVPLQAAVHSVALHRRMPIFWQAASAWLWLTNVQGITAAREQGRAALVPCPAALASTRLAS